ncbi:MAG: thiamine phosphate synthase [Lentihominibacter sp.]
MSDIICITNRKLCPGTYPDDFLARIEKIAARRPAAIILREKDMSQEEYTALASRVMSICHKYGTQCILHTFTQAALFLGSDAIHVPIPVLREMDENERKSFRLLGTSCHSVEDAAEAEKLGCTYITAGHVFPTDCKKGLACRGMGFLESVCDSVDIPVYAIGGIGTQSISTIRRSPAAGACIMSGFMQCADADRYFDELAGKVDTMKFSKENLQLYAVTDRHGMSMQDLYEKIEEGLKGGVTIVQLREKDLDEETFVAEAIRIKELCHSYNVPFIINDNVDVALKSGADGVHVGIEDRPVSEIREIAGKGFIIGATAKTIEQARNAEAAGADYLGVGAVFPSPTKKKVIRITHEQLSEICGSVSIPTVAIGGISIDNAEQLKGRGMDGIAVSSALFAAQDVKAAAEKLKSAVGIIR